MIQKLSMILPPWKAQIRITFYGENFCHKQIIEEHSYAGLKYALWLVKNNYVTRNSQWECFILAKHSHGTQKFNIDFYLVYNIGSQTCIFEVEEMTFSSFQSKVFNNRKQRNDIFVCFINFVIKTAIINFQGKYSLHWAS